MSRPLVIVGTGLAGYNLAREFRKLDKETPLVVVSRDHAGFYSKPMLSNALSGKKTAAALVMKAAEKMREELGATLHSKTELRRIDTASQTVEFAGGETLVYRDLVLALGADPIRLPLQGDAARHVMSVNDLDDYALFAERLEGADTVAILGAGLIGCEFANDLLHRGVAPTVIDVADRVLSRLLPPQLSERLQHRLEAAGAAFRLGVSVTRIDREGEPDQEGYEITLNDGRRLRADRVLSAIGLQPRTRLANEAGISTQRGISTDRWMATSAPHVHAIGDCAEVEGLSLPFVLPLMQQARALAATLAGTPTPVVYGAMPVTVKTPACPTVVCPPPPGAAGMWSIEMDEAGATARFTGPDGRLLGFGLLGTAVSQRQALAALVPGWLA